VGLLTMQWRASRAACDRRGVEGNELSKESG
jgi:hypothetical protein